MIPIGRLSHLRVLSRDARGLLLGDAREQVLLPHEDAPQSAEVGARLQIFVYTDSQGTPVATTQEPHAVVGEFACLRVVDVTAQGAYLDWGLDKDLFVPIGLWHRPMLVGQKHVVAVHLDERTGRVTAAGRLAEFFDYNVAYLEAGKPVKLLVYGFNDLGAQVVVDGRHAGLVYQSEIVTRLTIGSTLAGFVQLVRPDNKLDIVLRRQGAEGLADAENVILQSLKRAGGYLGLHDGSPPDEVRRVLALSKKSFKAALGVLYRKRKIQLLDDGIRLVSRETE